MTEIQRVVKPPRGMYERHAWLSKALLQYREQQALGNSGVLAGGESAQLSMARYYQSLMEELIPVKGGTLLYEIISDGLGQPEPYWHGILVGENLCRALDERERNDLAHEVENKRHSIGNLLSNTHRGLGRYLREPILFCVLGYKQGQTIETSEVHFFRNHTWYPISDVNSPLPLVTRTAETPDRDEIVAEVEETLRVLSGQVLWPTFWKVKPTRKYISLIAIYSSVGQENAGVWAIHAASDDPTRWGEVRLNERVVRQAMDPPMLCLIDVLAAEYERDSTHPRRIDDIRFFARSRGLAEDRLSDEKLFAQFSPVARLIYEREISPDYLEDYGRLLWEILRVHAKIRIPEAPKLPATVALEEAFVARRLLGLAEMARDRTSGNASSSGPERDPSLDSAMAKLLARDAMRLCASVLGTPDILGLDSHGPFEGNLERTIVRAVLTSARELGDWFEPTLYAMVALVQSGGTVQLAKTHITRSQARDEWLTELGIAEGATRRWATRLVVWFGLER